MYTNAAEDVGIVIIGLSWEAWVVFIKHRLGSNELFLQRAYPSDCIVCVGSRLRLHSACKMMLALKEVADRNLGAELATPSDRVWKRTSPMYQLVVMRR